MHCTSTCVANKINSMEENNGNSEIRNTQTDHYDHNAKNTGETAILRKPDILYRDENLFIIDKPYGYIVHSHYYDRKSPRCVDKIRRYTGLPVKTVHRLDKSTSGILLTALDAKSARHIGFQFQNREVQKHYLAIVRGHINEPQEVTIPLENDTKKEIYEAKSIIYPLSRSVIPEKIGKFDESWFSLVKVKLETGRYHQARRHLRRLNTPVIGDKQRGDKNHNFWAWNRYGIRYMFLRAYELAFTHPGTGEYMHVCAGLPEFWKTAIHDFGLEVPEDISVEPTVKIGEKAVEVTPLSTLDD